MDTITIWHNPRCSKSRAGVAMLEEQGVNAEIVRYLDTPPTAEELREVLEKLHIPARALMRTKEVIYKELGLGDIEDEQQLIAAMVAHPRLIERPVVIRGDKAVIGRPLENIIELIG